MTYNFSATNYRNMCRSILIKLFVFFSIINLESANYYFSNNIGKDNHTWFQAQNKQTPWKTLTKLNSIIYRLQPGDSILFKRGDIFYGSIKMSTSGTATSSIVFSAYGVGNKPQISGLSALSNWASKGKNLWEADCPLGGAVVNELMIDKIPKQIGRYPNASSANKGYLIFESHSGTNQITDNELSSNPNWTGAEVVIRIANYVIKKYPITNHSNQTLTFTNSNDTPKDKWGYFIQNSAATLDQYGEWYYNKSSKKMLIYTNSSNPSSLTVEVPTKDTLVSINKTNYITIDGLAIMGSNKLGISIYNSKNISVRNCDIHYSGVNGIIAREGSTYLNVENCSIEHTMNTAIRFYADCNQTIIRNNFIANTGLMQGSVGESSAIMSEGTNNLIEYNSIDSTGYVAIRFGVASATIKNNFMTNFCLIKDDGGGIYTWRGCDKTGTPEKSKIIGNIVINGIGAPEGTNPVFYQVHGIYMDDNSSNMEISGNVIAKISGGGIFLHNAHDMTVSNNTIFDNITQFKIAYGSNCPNGMIRNVAFNNNILFSKLASQQIFNFETSANDVKSFGVFDYNYYCRPANENGALRAITTNYNLQQWQTAYSKDINSHNTPKTVANPESSMRFEYNNTKTSNSISLDDYYIDVKGKSYSGSVTLEPFTAIILLKR